MCMSGARVCVSGVNVCVCVCVCVCACLRCAYVFVCVADYLQCVEVGQPDTVSPAQVPAEVVVTDVDGLQVPRFVPEEVQHIEALGGGGRDRRMRLWNRRKIFCDLSVCHGPWAVEKHKVKPYLPSLEVRPQ